VGNYLERFIVYLTTGALDTRSAAKRKLSSSTKKELAEAVSTRARDKGYRLFRDGFIELARDVLEAEGFEGPGSRALEIWRALAGEIKMQRGHPMGEQTRERMEADKDNLKLLMQEVLSGASSALAQTKAES
jgi:hypothetical protein